MGNAFCSNYDSDSVMSSKDYLRTLARMAPKTGGGSVATVGGYSSLEDYGNSMFSKAKGDLIRSIAKDVAGVLKISSSFAASADLKDVIAKWYLKQIVKNFSSMNLRPVLNFSTTYCKSVHFT